VPKNAKQILDKVRRDLEEVTTPDVQGNYFLDLGLLEAMNEGQGLLVADIVEAAEDYFGTFQDIDFLSGVAAYPLPPGFLRHRHFEYIFGGIRVAIIENRMEVEDDFDTTATAVSTANTFNYAFALYGDEINIDPAPGSNQSGAARFWYIRKPPGLIFGKATAGSSTTITLQAADSADGPAASAINDDYNNTVIVITGGTGVGQRRKIQDYDGDTKVATVATAWASDPDNTSVYATETWIPEPFDDAIALYATAAGKSARDEDARSWTFRFNAFHDKLLAFVEQRTTADRSFRVWDPTDGV
jgi:hypothetical protein